MKYRRLFFILLTFFVVLECFATKELLISNYVGTTPGDAIIKLYLGIGKNEQVDFIKWNLDLKKEDHFSLFIQYGVSLPNTLGFINGGKSEKIIGRFSKIINENNKNEIYLFKGNDNSVSFSIVKINDNLFHIVDSECKLLNGNGGWSYVLSKNIPINASELSYVFKENEQPFLKEEYVGRTPCKEYALLHAEIKASAACFKLKWKLILFRDSVSLEPTKCIIRNIVDNNPRDKEAKWESIFIKQGTFNQHIYKIILDNQEEPILLLVLSNEVLYFLDNNFRPLNGNADFSFALNKVDL